MKCPKCGDNMVLLFDWGCDRCLGRSIGNVEPPTSAAPGVLTMARQGFVLMVTNSRPETYENQHLLVFPSLVSAQDFLDACTEANIYRAPRSIWAIQAAEDLIFVPLDTPSLVSFTPKRQYLVAEQLKGSERRHSALFVIDARLRYPYSIRLLHQL